MDTIVAISNLTLINIAAIILIFKKGSYFLDHSKWIVVLEYLLAAFALSGLYFLIGKKSKIGNLHYSEKRVKTGNIVLVSYISISILILFISLITHP